MPTKPHTPDRNAQQERFEWSTEYQVGYKKGYKKGYLEGIEKTLTLCSQPPPILTTGTDILNALREIAVIAAKANTAGAGRMDEWDALSEIETLARKAVEK